MGKRVLLAVNPRARRGSSARQHVAAALRELGHDVVDAPPDGPPSVLCDAIRAHRDDVDVVVIGGGDGTLLAALPGLVETKLPVAIVPLGTFNELARTLGVPHAPADVAALVDDGVPVPIDLGRVNGVYYVNEASIGLSTQVARLQTGAVKRSLGMLALPLATLRALRWMRPLHVEIEAADGTTTRMRAVQVTVANSYRFGGVVENPEASLEDGALWVYGIDVTGWWHTLRVLAAVIARRFQRAPEVATLKGPRFTIRSLRGGRHRILADSEEVGRLPASFDVVPRALTVLVPPQRVSSIR
jgi:YegS/Rv2252/BmrU family lipid kinase